MNKEITIKLKKLDEKAVIPTYAHVGDVGMDMTAISVEYDKEKDLYIYHTGLAFESDFNIGQFLFPRSSNRKTDAYLCNGVGIADSAIYRGEILFCYKNRTSLEVDIELKKHRAFVNALISTKDMHYAQEDVEKIESHFSSEKNLIEYAMTKAPYKVGDRIGQMVFSFYPTVNIECVDELSDSERGANGFGSTGS